MIAYFLCMYTGCIDKDAYQETGSTKLKMGNALL